MRDSGGGCLSSFLDYLIKLMPYFLCMVPYYVVIFSMGMNESDIAEMEDFPIALAVALGAGFLGIMGCECFLRDVDGWKIPGDARQADHRNEGRESRWEAAHLYEGFHSLGHQETG